MIDPDILEGLDGATRLAVNSAFATLAESGVIEQQLQRELQRVAEGDAEQDDAILVKSIREYRWKASLLRVIKEHGETFLKEKIDEEDES